jgi:Ca2+/H+ antiporter
MVKTAPVHIHKSCLPVPLTDIARTQYSPTEPVLISEPSQCSSSHTLLHSHLSFSMSPRRSRYLSPPPPTRLDRRYRAHDPLKQVGTAMAAALQNMHRDTSAFHRLLASQLLVVVVFMELLKTDRPDPLLSVLLGLLKVALVADCTSIMTLRMRRIASSSKVLDSLLSRVPFAAVPVVELALAMQMLRQKPPSSANRFLTGSIYAKLLVAGACSTILYGLRCGSAAVELRSTKMSPVPWLLGMSGALVLASAPQIESMFRGPHKLLKLTITIGNSQWISRGVPLFIMLYVGISYYFELHGGGRQRPLVLNEEEEEEDGTGVAVREWAVLLFCVGALKAGAFVLARDLLECAHAMIAISDSPSTSLTSSVFVDFIVLPLAAAAVDHLPDIAPARTEDVDQPWTHLIQSALQTYFFTRPLAALAGHDINPQDGRMGIGFCVLAIAGLLLIPGIPRKSISFHMAC